MIESIRCVRVYDLARAYFGNVDMSQKKIQTRSKIIIFLFIFAFGWYKGNTLVLFTNLYILKGKRKVFNKFHIIFVSKMYIFLIPIPPDNPFIHPHTFIHTT